MFPLFYFYTKGINKKKAKLIAQFWGGSIKQTEEITNSGLLLFGLLSRMKGSI